MILDTDRTRLFPVIIAAEEIAVETPREIGQQCGAIFPPAQIHSLRVIHVLVYLMCNGPMHKLYLPVEHRNLRIRREDNLVVLISTHSGIEIGRASCRERAQMLEVA